MSNFDKSNRMSPVIVTVDAGNNNLKAIVLKHDGSGLNTKEILIPHGFIELTETAWKQAKSNAMLSRIRQGLTHTFRVESIASPVSVMIGEGAMKSPRNSPLYGNDKYREGGIDALVLALLCEAFPIDQYPKGHDNIIVGFGFPPSEWQQASKIAGLIARKHEIVQPATTRGGKDITRKFHIRAAIPFDEIIGGIVYASNRTRNESGQFVKRHEPGQTILALDAGGRLGSMGWVEIGETGFPEINYESFLPIDGGAITVRNDLRDTLKTAFPEDLQSMRHADMNDKWLDKLLETQEIRIRGGEPLDIQIQIQDSLHYIRTLKGVYTNEFASGIQADSILLTGGTVKPLYQYIVSMLNHNDIRTAATLDQIVMANVRGGQGITLEALVNANVAPKFVMEAMNHA